MKDPDFVVKYLAYKINKNLIKKKFKQFYSFFIKIKNLNNKY